MGNIEILHWQRGWQILDAFPTSAKIRRSEGIMLRGCSRSSWRTTLKTQAARKHTIFLSGVGAHTYTLLRSLVHPAKLGEKRSLLGIPALRWRPISIQIKPSITVHHFKFNSHAHQPGESVATFVAARIVSVGRTLPVWWRFE